MPPASASSSPDQSPGPSNASSNGKRSRSLLERARDAIDGLLISTDKNARSIHRDAQARREAAAREAAREQGNNDPRTEQLERPEEYAQSGTQQEGQRQEGRRPPVATRKRSEPQAEQAPEHGDGDRDASDGATALDPDPTPDQDQADQDLKNQDHAGKDQDPAKDQQASKPSFKERLQKGFALLKERFLSSQAGQWIVGHFAMTDGDKARLDGPGPAVKKDPEVRPTGQPNDPRFEGQEPPDTPKPKYKGRHRAPTRKERASQGKDAKKQNAEQAEELASAGKELVPIKKSQSPTAAQLHNAGTARKSGGRKTTPKERAAQDIERAANEIVRKATFDPKDPTGVAHGEFLDLVAFAGNSADSNGRITPQAARNFAQLNEVRKVNRSLTQGEPLSRERAEMLSAALMTAINEKAGNLPGGQSKETLSTAAKSAMGTYLSHMHAQQASPSQGAEQGASLA